MGGIGCFGGIAGPAFAGIGLPLAAFFFFACRRMAISLMAPLTALPSLSFLPTS